MESKTTVEGYELSPQQKRVWQLRQRGGAYEVRAKIGIEGKVDEEVLHRALKAVVERHEILRTTYERRPGMKYPLQVIGEQAEIEWRVREAGASESDGAVSTPREEVREEVREEGGAVLRAELVKGGDGRQELEIRMDALNGDGQSLRNLFQDLARCYEAALQSEELSDEQMQYAVFADWQNEMVSGTEEDAEAGREHWRRQLSGDASLLSLPLEKTAEQRGEFKPDAVRLSIEKSELEELSKAAARHKVSESGWLSACWAGLLSRLSAQSEIVLGEGVSGRKYEELEGGIGAYAKWLPVSARVNASTRFSDFAQLLEDARRNNSEYQEYFAVEEDEQAGEVEMIFAAGFEYVVESDARRAGDVRFSLTDEYACIEPFKVKLNCLHRRDSLLLELQYDSNLYERETIARMSNQFVALLKSSMEMPEAAIGELNILSVEERDMLRHAFNRTNAEYPIDKNFHQLFEEQVERTPERIAVICGAEQLTYAELNAKANRLAHCLRRKGVAADVRVGFCVDRSVEMLVGMLGIMKAGGAYVPLSAEYPKERLRRQIEEIGSTVLLTQEKYLDRLPEFDGETLCLERDAAQYGSEPATNPSPVNVPEHLVYVIYTSGSSGVPKGVAVSHRSLVNYASFIVRRLDAASASQPLEFATVSTVTADLGNTAIFPSLLSGGRLHILDYEVTTDAHLFAGYLERHPIDVLKIVPSHLSALLTSATGNRALPRKFLFLGGEALPYALLHRIEQSSTGCRVINHYGPTEATVGALVNTEIENVAGREERAGALPSTVPIGMPLANAEAYILDERLSLVPLGCIGELYLGGDGLARGYLNQPAQTAERFVPHPFTDGKGARLYRTGDLARRWPDGKIEYMGRIDGQVKIRGFRVETGEIEAALRQHSKIAETIVAAREDEPGHKRLVAYVVLKARGATSTGDLQDYVKERLPDYMVPAAFVILDRLPLTANGKVDRRALPAPEQAGDEAGRAYAAPRTDMQSALAAIWKDVLHVERVGIRDNFFGLGGDSILSIQIVAKARQAGLQITPKQLFQFQTIEELATVAVSSVAASQAEQSAVMGDVPLTPIQHWFFEQQLDDPNHFNQSVMLHAPHDANPSQLRQAVASLLAHHDALRLRFERTESGRRQYHATPDDAVPFVHVDLSHVAEGEQRAAIEEEAAKRQRSLHLSEGPVLRVVLLTLGAGRTSRLLMIAHHLVIDGVSWRILLEDLRLACEQLRRGEAVKLPLKTTSFKQWAEKLRDYARSEALSAEVPFWLDATEQSGTGLPIDDTEGANTRESAQTLTMELDAGETESLLKEVPAAYRTEINDALLAALVLAVRTWSGRHSLTVEMEGHGREELGADVDVTRTIGWFTTHYPVRLSTGAETDGVATLRNVKERLRSVPQRGLGYGLLRRMRGDEVLAERLRGSARPEVKFNYLGQLDQSFDDDSGFGMARESGGATQSSGGMRAHLLEVNAGVLDGRLFLRWVYSEQLHRRATIEKLAAFYMSELRGLIRLCRANGAAGYTPSDFPAARLSQTALDKFVAGLDAEGAKPSSATRSIEDLYELSPMQEGMLFHNILSPESDIYFRQLSCSLHGRLNRTAFEQAWQRVIDEHPVLRASFHWKNLEAPLQAVSRHVKLPLEYHDWSGRSPAEQEQQLEAMLNAERSRNFILTEVPLMRLVLIRLAEDVHRLIWSYHHLLMDGWAKHEVFNQILALYRAYDGGRELELEPRRPYRDYIAWLQQQDMQGAETFWRRALKGFTQPTIVGTQHATEGSGASSKKAQYDKQHIFVPAETTAQLRDFARRHQVTLNTVVQGAWALLLSRYSAQNDVVFGAVMSGRPPMLEGAGKMIGLFINTLPVRVQMEDTESVTSWLRGLQEQQVEVRQYEYSPLVRVQGWSEIPKGQSLFETLLTFENYPIDAAAREQNATVEVRDYQVVENNSYPLTLMVGPGNELSLLLIYDRERFPHANAEEMLGRLTMLFTSLAAAEPDAELRELREAVEAAWRQQELLREKALKDVRLQKFKDVKRKAVRSVASAIEDGR